MTFIHVFDALNGKRIAGFDLKDGTPFRCEPVLVDYVRDSTVLANAWISVDEEGLTLNFTSRDPSFNKRLERVPVFNIARVL